MRFVVIGFLILLLTACESNPPAPVISRSPQTTKPKPPVANKPNIVTTNKDWRPDSHVVKKGETLFAIGLEYGIDYKEIAAANNIAAPYPIQIGQKIDLTSFKTKMPSPVTTDTSKSEANRSEDDSVVVTPMKSEPPVTDAKSTQDANKPITSAVTPILSEPKAMREAYSLEALNRTTNKPVDMNIATNKPVEVKPSDSNPNITKPSDANLPDDEAITWVWPTQGKVTTGFNETSNKGIDIAGTTGQTINAASAGKVIYSGSDLRGYGKLVIVKHNKTYLSVYAHNSKIAVKEGQVVNAGQKIAEMGNTDSNTVKLHFEIRRLGKSVDPAKYLTQN
jgi:lipoprotein NlpD